MNAVGPVQSPQLSPGLRRGRRGAQLHVPYVYVRVGMDRVGRASLNVDNGILRFFLQMCRVLNLET